MQILLFAAALLLALHLPHSLFLVGQGAVGENISVLCENQERVFVSSPDSQTQMLSLDSSYQASFAPSHAGPYAVQCGNETEVVQVAASAEGVAMEKAQSDWLLLAGVLVFVSLLAACAMFIAKDFMVFPSGFSKRVEGKNVELLLRSRKKLERLVIEDRGLGKKLEIGTLPSGKEWKWAYESEETFHLPAELEAVCDGKPIRMLSELHVDGKKGEGMGVPKEKDAGKRPLPKA